MENEQENVDVELDLEGEESPEAGKGFKPHDLPEVKLAKAKAIASRYAKQAARLEAELGIETPKPKTEEKKSGELDYGQKAFLISNGIKGEDEIGLVKKIQSTTGKSLEEILDSKYFKSDLKDLRDAREGDDAIPKGTKRSTQSARDSVEYWLNKPHSEVPAELKREVLNRQIQMKKDSGKFSNNPVVMS